MKYLKILVVLAAFVFLCGFGGGPSGGGGGISACSGDINAACTQVTGLTHAGGSTLDNVVVGGTTPVALTAGPYKVKPTVITHTNDPYSVAATDTWISCSSTGLTHVDLPAATGTGRILTIEQTGSGSTTNTCTIVPNGSDTIEGINQSVLMMAQNTIITLMDAASGAWRSPTGSAQLFTGQGDTFQISSGSAHAGAIWWDDSNSYLDIENFTSGKINLATNAGVKLSITNTGIVIGTETTSVATMARMPLTFPIAAVAATTTTQWGETKVVKALTIENAVYSVGAFTCSVNPAISVFDCSSTAGTCTPVSTLATSGTLTGIGVTNAATTPTANVAAGEYIAAEFTAGTCTVLNGSVTLMARPQ